MKCNLFLLGIIVISFVACSSASNEAYQIVFTSKRENSRQLYYFDHEMAEPMILAPELTHVRDPKISEDGNWIVFSSEQEIGNPASSEIVLFNLLSMEYKFLTDNEIFDGLPDISFNGTSIVYVSEDSKGNHEIMLHDLQKQTYAQLTNHGGLNLNPYWLEDEIFFISDKGNLRIFPKFDLYKYDFEANQAILVQKIQADGQIEHNGYDYLVESDISNSKIRIYFDDFFSSDDISKQFLINQELGNIYSNPVLNKHPVWLNQSHFAYLKILTNEDSPNTMIELVNINNLESSPSVLLSGTNILEFDIIQRP